MHACCSLPSKWSLVLWGLYPMITIQLRDASSIPDFVNVVWKFSAPSARSCFSAPRTPSAPAPRPTLRTRTRLVHGTGGRLAVCRCLSLPGSSSEPKGGTEKLRKAGTVKPECAYAVPKGAPPAAVAGTRGSDGPCVGPSPVSYRPKAAENCGAGEGSTHVRQRKKERDEREGAWGAPPG